MSMEEWHTWLGSDRGSVVIFGSSPRRITSEKSPSPPEDLHIHHSMFRALEQDSSIPVQRRLNFEMSAKNLFQSLADRERVPKIQGLVNECMTFLDDELSVITGPYEDLLSIDEVIEQELILFVTLNVNKNT